MKINCQETCRHIHAAELIFGRCKKYKVTTFCEHNRETVIFQVKYQFVNEFQIQIQKVSMSDVASNRFCQKTMELYVQKMVGADYAKMST